MYSLYISNYSIHSYQAPCKHSLQSGWETILCFLQSESDLLHSAILDDALELVNFPSLIITIEEDLIHRATVPYTLTNPCITHTWDTMYNYCINFTCPLGHSIMLFVRPTRGHGGHYRVNILSKTTIIL